MPVQLLRRLAPRRCALVHAAKAPRAIPGPGSYWTGSARRSARSVSYEPSAPAGPLPYRQPGRLRGCVPPRHPNARRRLDRGRSGLYFVHCAACCSPGWLGFGRPRWAGAEQLGEFHPGPVQAAGNLDKKDIAFGTARARIAPEPDRFHAAAPFCQVMRERVSLSRGRRLSGMARYGPNMEAASHSCKPRVGFSDDGHACVITSAAIYGTI
jgi:hypothetical protein